MIFNWIYLYHIYRQETGLIFGSIPGGDGGICRFVVCLDMKKARRHWMASFGLGIQDKL